MWIIRALEPLVNVAVAGAFFALGYVDNLREVMPVEQQESKHHLIGLHCALGRGVIMKS